MKKTIGVIGSPLISGLVPMAEIVEQQKIIEETKNLGQISKAPSSFDDSKCNKGHSYEKEYDEKITMKVIWKCSKCGRRL